MADTKLIKLTEAQAAMLVYLATAGIEYTMGEVDKHENIIIKKSEQFFVFAAAMMKRAGVVDNPIAGRLEVLNHYNDLIGPLSKWLDTQSASADNNQPKEQ